jgi:hypothetical protein
MGLIRYKAANDVGAGGVTAATGALIPGPGPVVEWEETAEKKSLNIRRAMEVTTTWTTAGTDGTFFVDDVKYPELVAALDEHPFVYRAGGGSPQAADVTRTD